MCTAIHLCKEGLFGRTLDFETGFGEKIVFTPREHMTMGDSKNRYAMLGACVVKEGSSLYFDGLNEWGLTGAALNFPGYAKYHSSPDKKADIPSAIFLSFVLGFCKNISEIKDLLTNVSITGDLVHGLPPAPLHWIFADKTGAITVESTKKGLFVMDNPYGVLTNSPDFEYHQTRLSDYMALNAGYPENKLAKIPLAAYSRGMGAIGLPGDFSSASRFVRAVFIKENTTVEEGESKINDMMKMLASVSVPCGCVRSEEGRAVMTLYSSVMDSENLIYYFNSYSNPRLRGVKLHPEGEEYQTFSIYEKEQIKMLK